MKNILAENLHRFGVKNLKDNTIKLNEQEVVDDLDQALADEGADSTITSLVWQIASSETTWVIIGGAALVAAIPAVFRALLNRLVAKIGGGSASATKIANAMYSNQLFDKLMTTRSALNKIIGDKKRYSQRVRDDAAILKRELDNLDSKLSKADRTVWRKKALMTAIEKDLRPIVRAASDLESQKKAIKKFTGDVMQGTKATPEQIKAVYTQVEQTVKSDLKATTATVKKIAAMDQSSFTTAVYNKLGFKPTLNQYIAYKSAVQQANKNPAQAKEIMQKFWSTIRDY